MSEAPPFCADRGARAHYSRICDLVRAAGYEVSDGDSYVLGAFANAAARLDELAERVAKERSLNPRLRLMGAERLARNDITRLVDQVERHFAGVDVEEAVPELKRTGTGGVVEFPKPVASVVGQRIVSAVARASSGLTRDQLRKAVSGGKQPFLRALRECVESGAIRRTGAGSRGSPHVYLRR